MQAVSDSWRPRGYVVTPIGRGQFLYSSRDGRSIAVAVDLDLIEMWLERHGIKSPAGTTPAGPTSMNISNAKASAVSTALQSLGCG